MGRPPGVGATGDQPLPAGGACQAPGAAAPPETGVPQEPQNFAPGARAVPHLAQARPWREAPQLLQNFPVAEAPHEGQLTVISYPSLYCGRNLAAPAGRDKYGTIFLGNSSQAI